MTLPEPSFIDRDPSAILAECIAQFEAETGKPLLPSQVERILIDLIVYRETLLRIGIQEAAKQNLRAYARFPMLDLLGELIGTERLAAVAAITTLRCSLPAPAAAPELIPAGTEVPATDGTVFVTDADVQIEIASSSVDVGGTAVETGPSGNGYAAGQVTVELGDLTIVNLTETAFGADEETSDAFRERLPLAAQALSVAGPGGAYRFFAISAHPDVVDAAASRPEPGVVRVAVLGRDGVPSVEMLDAVTAAISDDEDVRPLTDTVLVESATPVDYEIEAVLKLYRGAKAEDVLPAANAEAAKFVAERSGRLGRDLIPSQVSSKLGVAGVYEVELLQPPKIEIAADEWARNVGISVTFGGFSEEDLP